MLVGPLLIAYISQLFYEILFSKAKVKNKEHSDNIIIIKPCIWKTWKIHMKDKTFS